MSKKTQATVDRMHSEMVAKMVQTAGTRPDGVTMVAESGTASLYLESLQDMVNRLHAERDQLVVKAREVRMEKGVTSPEFAAAWFDVERLTRDLIEAEAGLAKIEAGGRKAAAGSGAAEETPLKRAAGAAMDLCAMIGKLSDEDTIKAVEVLKCGVMVEMLARAQRKVVTHG